MFDQEESPDEGNSLSCQIDDIEQMMKEHAGDHGTEKREKPGKDTNQEQDVRSVEEAEAEVGDGPFN